MIFCGCPLAFGFGLHAFLRALDRGWACAALILSGFELIGWSFIILMMFLRMSM